MNIAEILRSQARRIRCSQCGESMADCEINVLVEQGNQALVRTICTNCHDENLLKVVVQTGTETDRRAPRQPLFDEEHPLEADPIDIDDVLDARAALSAWNGDLRELLPGR